MPAIQRDGESTGQHESIPARTILAPNWNSIAAALVCLTVVSGLAPQSSWAVEPAHVIRSEAHRVYTPFKRRVWVAVSKPPKAPLTAMINAPRFNVPQEELVEVQLIHTTIYIDPNADYIHQGNGRVDANGIIPTAQRLYRSLSAKPARIIRRHDAKHTARRLAPTTIRPHMIMMKPPHLDQPENKKRNPGKRRIPTVPGPPKKKPRLMAMATGDINL